jgi:fucose 4-O-acetylase-like acetyltransferase
MKGYKGLMTEPTQQRIDTAIKFGSVIAEACLFLLLILISYTLQMDPFAKLGFGLAKVTFDVNASLRELLVIFYLQLSRLAIKRAAKIR